MVKEFYGPFEVDSSMVWVDKKNTAKVWLNKNYYLNEYTPSQENLMVLQIK